MTTALLLVTLTLKTLLPPLPSWLGEDKFKHFFASFVATSMAATGARAAGLDRDASIVVGVSFGAGAGIWKEIRDSRGTGVASAGDLLFDGLGIGTSFLLLDAAE